MKKTLHFSSFPLLTLRNPAVILLAHLSCPFRRQDAGQSLRGLPLHFVWVDQPEGKPFYENHPLH